MKVIAVYGSARKKGFSSLAVDTAADYFANKGAEIKRYRLPDMEIKQCRGCFSCKRKEGCILKDDMTELFEEIVSADLVIFGSPIYCFDVSGTFKLMFERLYPMLAGGMPLGEGLQKYTHRYAPVKCMMLYAQGAPSFMCHKVRKQMKSNLKENGFTFVGSVVIDSTYQKKTFALTEKQKQKIIGVCEKAAVMPSRAPQSPKA